MAFNILSSEPTNISSVIREQQYNADGSAGQFNANTIYKNPNNPEKNTSNDTNYNQPI